MNRVEREIYDEYAYDKEFKYVWQVYSEFVVRSKNKECLFDHWSWERRLNLSYSQLDTALKN